MQNGDKQNNFPSVADNFSIQIPALLEKFKLSSATARQFLERFNEIDEAYSLMSDEFSKARFVRELSYLVLRDIDHNLAYQICAEDTPEDVHYWYEQASEHHLFDYIDCAALSDTVKSLSSGYFLSNIFLKEQYAYVNHHTVIRPTSDDICIDAGACHGDTAIWLTKFCDVSKVYAFEMIPENAEICRQNFARYPDLASRIEVVTSGLGDLPSTRYYTNLHPENKGAFSLILNLEKYTSKYGTDNIQTACITSIDHFCEERKLTPTYIKMDIEGAENLALRGAQHLLSRAKPKLAICTYHWPCDVFELPLLIKSFNQEYRFFLNKYSRGGETVLFCI